MEKQRSEIISEAEAQRLERQGQGSYINYHTYVELNDEIMIDHYRENDQSEVARPVSGANKELRGSDNQKNMSSGVITHPGEKENQKLDIEFLLKYFQEHDIKQISLTPDGNLLVEYNSGKSEIITNDQTNKAELQKVISYYQKSKQTNLSQQDLTNMNNANSPTEKSKDNKAIWIGCGIGGVLTLGVIIDLIMKKNRVKKNNL